MAWKYPALTIRTIAVGIFLALVNLAFAADTPATVVAERNGVGEAGSFDSGNFERAVESFV